MVLWMAKSAQRLPTLKALPASFHRVLFLQSMCFWSDLLGKEQFSEFLTGTEFQLVDDSGAALKAGTFWAPKKLSSLQHSIVFDSDRSSWCSHKSRFILRFCFWWEGLPWEFRSTRCQQTEQEGGWTLMYARTFAERFHARVGTRPRKQGTGWDFAADHAERQHASTTFFEENQLEG